MIGNNGFNWRYEVMIYRGPGSCVETSTVKRSELVSLRSEPFDYIVDLSRGTYAFRDGYSELIHRTLRGSGMGMVCLAIIEALLVNAGVALTIGEIAQLTGNENLLDSSNFAARLYSIRKAHDESGRRPRMFLSFSKPEYGVLWPAEFSWLWITRIPDLQH